MDIWRVDIPVEGTHSYTISARSEEEAVNLVMDGRGNIVDSELARDLSGSVYARKL